MILMDAVVRYDTLCSEDGVLDPNVRDLLRDRGVRRERFTVINYPHVSRSSVQDLTAHNKISRPHFRVGRLSLLFLCCGVAV